MTDSSIIHGEICVPEVPENIEKENGEVCTDELEEDEDEKKKCLELLKEQFQIITKRVTENFPACKDSVKSFVKSCQTNIKSESSLVPALASFGKYNGAGRPLIKRNLQGGRTI